MDKDIKTIDILDRQQFVDDVKGVIRLLSEDRKNVTFAINGQWGVGKTFVLEMLEEQLKDDYIILHFNAWENDYYEEPLIALLATIIGQLKKEFACERIIEIIGKDILKNVVKSLVKIVGEISKNKIGVNIPEVLQGFYKKIKKHDEEDESFDSNIGIKRKIEEVKKQLSVLSQKATVIVVVDELDRCLPEYAIKVLERLHHVFTGVENLQVILSIDKEKLENTVDNIFGKQIGNSDLKQKNEIVDGYLRKFIKFTIKLENGEINSAKYDEKFAEYNSHFDILFDITKKDDVDFFIKNLLMHYDTRTKINIIDKAKFLHTLLPENKDKKDLSYMCLELLLVVCEKEKYLLADRFYNSPINNTFLANNEFKFFYNKIAEYDERKDEHVRYSCYDNYNHNKVTIHIIDIWSLLWFNICRLYGGEISKQTQYTFFEGIAQNVNLDVFLVYENAFMRLCTFIK